MQANPYSLEQLSAAYKNSCMAELQALKPGNVHAFADGHGMTIYDFIKSAEVSASVIAKADISVGERILGAIAATQHSVGLNTNLGLVLLCAPLIHAAWHRSAMETLQQSLSNTLRQLTVDDAMRAGQAIVLANPAGLGRADEYDVKQTPSVSLLEMMRSAQTKDRIAWQYAHDFSDIFDFGLARYAEAMAKWQNQAWATTALYLGFLTRQLDSHIVRKYGESLAIAVRNEARDIEVEYWATNNPKLMQKKLLAWDVSLKQRDINPGTSADLTVASLLLSALTDSSV
ncbi:MAG: triphosphoribosyl-dephospho-CoA synthase [Methylotenera sp.]|nr:triphosphoribosyl-dephospho-CoA synthase [Methylotenera sp.]MSP99354.1 triphosphoribosyl-dephospho-CoA synthase [Methylotenera sp.]